ncbi:MAG: DUF2723 domain-containing protein, partial [bacterium]
HDSGELITCAYTLGIAHPPGYPLYTLFGKVFVTLIPIGNIAFRMNMQSSLFASLACMMVYFITLKLSTRAPEHQSTRIIPSIVASLTLAFSLTFWEQAVIAEKYTLNALFATLVIFILLKWQEGSRVKGQGSRLLYLFSFILGLSFTHHFQTIYLVPASIFFILATLWEKNPQSKIRNPKLKNPKSAIRNLLLMLFLFLLPLTLWLYLPLRASQEPVMNWDCPDNWQRLIWHISCKNYRATLLEPMIQSFKLRFIPHLNLFMYQFRWYFIFLGIACFIFLFAKRLTCGAYLFLMIVTNFLIAIRYNIPNIEDYYILSFLLFSILVGLCVYFLYSLFCTLWYKFLPHYYLILCKTIFCVFFLILPVLQFKEHYYSSAYFNHYISYDHGRNLLKYVKEKAVIFLEGNENVFPFWYLHYVEHLKSSCVPIVIFFLWKDQLLQDQPYINQIKGKYPDINLTTFVDKNPVVSMDDFRKIRVTELIENNPRRRPIYVKFDKNLLDKYGLIPEGILWRVSEKKLTREELIEQMDKNEPIFNLQRILVKTCSSKNENYHRNLIISKYLNLFQHRGVFYVSYNKYEKAIKEFEKALRIYPEDSKTWCYLGILYFQKDFIEDKAIKAFETVLKLDPNNTYAKQMLKECKKNP